MRSGNPTLNTKTFKLDRPVEGEVMTLQGTVNKTGLSLLIVVLTASLMWGQMVPERLGVVIGCAVAGFIVGLVTIFKKSWAHVTTPIYAALEGLVLGGISFIYEQQFPGIVIHSVTLTFGTLFGLLAAYQSRLIKATENFKLGVVAATLGIAVMYLVDLAMHFFGRGIPFIHEGSPLGILVSAVIVVIAALNLVLDFDFIEKGAENGAPKYMEWYGAFGLMVTLIWLYMEILRLLAKLRSRD